MENRDQVYQKLISAFELLIQLPDTKQDEDEALKAVLMILTRYRDEYATSGQAYQTAQPVQGQPLQRGLQTNEPMTPIQQIKNKLGGIQ